MSADSQLSTGVTTVRNLVLTCDDVAADERSTRALPAASAVVTALAARTTGVSPVAVRRSRTAASPAPSVVDAVTSKAYGNRFACGITSLARPVPDHDSVATAPP